MSFLNYNKKAFDVSQRLFYYLLYSDLSDFVIFSFSISMLYITGSYLLIFPVPKSIRNPGQNNIFHNALALNADSITNGVFLYTSFEVTPKSWTS